MTGQILNYNVAVYIFVQSEEEYSLIWKAKPIAIEKKQVKYDKNELLGRHHSLETSYIINFILKTFQLLYNEDLRRLM